MIFMSYWFAAFAVLFFVCYWGISNPTIRQSTLLLFGAAFQVHFAGPAGVYPILFLTILTYLAGISGSVVIQKVVVVTCVASLVFYKYTTFVCLQVVGLFNAEIATSLLSELRTSALPEAPPLAISFFVFEFVHYLSEVMRGRHPMKSIREFGIFALFWPTMVAGPIKRYQQFETAIQEGSNRVTRDDVMVGVARVSIGLVKKFAADNLTLMLDYYVPQFDSLPLSTRWMIFIGIGLRILLDFSGYSDMAIGFSRMMGVRVPENFNWPYVATSVRDFWQRWHISLSSWIRDYVYIPLGGGRHGTPRKITNSLIAMALCGLWHGAGWNFMFWGVFHGVGLGVNTAFNARFGETLSKKMGVQKIVIDSLSWLATMLFVLTGWLYFFYPIEQANHMLAMLVRLK